MNDTGEKQISLHIEGDVLYIEGTGKLDDFLMNLDSSDGIKHVYISEGITEIDDNYFYGYKDMESIHLPKSLQIIGYQAFEDCCRLSSITIPEGVKYIADEAFRGCISLTSLVIPDSVEIGRRLFAGCTELVSVKLPNQITEIDESMFCDFSKLSSVNIPAEVKTIGRYAFKNCSALKKVTFPEGLEFIGECAFANCRKLESIHILCHEYMEIERYAFINCTSLSNLVLENFMGDIHWAAFEGCPDISEVLVDRLRFNSSIPYFATKYDEILSSLLKNDRWETFEGRISLHVRCTADKQVLGIGGQNCWDPEGDSWVLAGFSSKSDFLGYLEKVMDRYLAAHPEKTEKIRSDYAALLKKYEEYKFPKNLE